MMKSLLLTMAFCLSGCILYLEEPSHNDSRDYSTTEDLWIYNAYMDCRYDYYYGESVWDFAIEVGSSYSYRMDEITVGVYLDGWDYYDFYHDGYEWWSLSIATYYTDCNDVYYADFVVSDVYGNYDEVTMWW